MEKSRETTIISIGMTLVLVDFILPIEIPFLSCLAIGFMANFLSFRSLVKTIVFMSAIFSMNGVKYGGLIGYAVFFFTFLWIFSNMAVVGTFLFRKYKMRERLGIW